MKNLLFVLLLCALSGLSSSCKSNTEKSDENIEVVHESTEQNSKQGFTDFLEEIRIGYLMSAISKHMIHTPYKYLGEDQGRMNYEANDENNVNHFISFVTFNEKELSSLVYNLDFKKSNTALVMDYQKKIQAQLQESFGDYFETGYDDFGFYIVDWHFEAFQVIFTTGSDFITVEMND